MVFANPRILDEWRRLYEQAQFFRAREPWNWLTDEQIFAVEEPDTGEVAYCCVMGAAGIEYGLAAYRGITGLRAYTLVANDALDDDEALLVQDCLTLDFGDREMLLPEDREIHKALGLRFRGRGAWPIFRAHRPGFLPVLPTWEEARLLSACLEQTCAFTHDVASGRPLPVIAENHSLARTRQKDGTWETTSLPFPPPPAPPLLDVGEPELERLQRSYSRSSQTWEVAVQTVAPIAEDPAAPYWAWMLICVEQKSGFVLPGDIAGPGASVQQQFLKTVERAGVLPRRIHITSDLLESQLAPLMGPLGIEARWVERLPMLETARRSLQSAFRRA